MDKLNFTTKIYEACLKDDELRPLMMCVHFQNGFAYASDAHIAIRQSLEYHTIINPELLDNKSIHRDSMKAIMQFDNATCTEDGIQCLDKDGRAAFFEYFDRKGEDQPNFDKVFDKISLQGVTFIGIDPENLARVNKALYCPAGFVKIEFSGVTGAMLITVPDIENQEGIVMPYVLNGSLFSKP